MAINKHTIFLLISLCFYCQNLQSQKLYKKRLFFFQDTIQAVGCGTVTYASVLFFVSDTTAVTQDNAINHYYVVIECPELYGNNFFRKKVGYNLLLSKDYKKIQTYFSKQMMAEFKKSKNLYLCTEISVDKSVQ